MGTIDRRILHNGMRDWLQAAVEKTVGLGQAPKPADAIYCIIYPITSGRGDGSFFNPEEDRDWVYQVSTFGPKRDDAFWLSSKVTEAFLGRDASGKYLHPIVIDGVNVQWRLSDNLGGIVPSGDSLHEAQDTYRIRTGA